MRFSGPRIMEAVIVAGGKRFRVQVRYVEVEDVRDPRKATSGAFWCDDMSIIDVLGGPLTLMLPSGGSEAIHVVGQTCHYDLESSDDSFVEGRFIAQCNWRDLSIR